MANAYNYSNVAVPTTLAGNISAGATTVSVVSTVGFPTVPYIIAIDYGASTEELMKVTSVAGLALTGTRGFGGTSAQTHSLGAVVRPVYNAQDAIDFRTHEDSTVQHGATGAVVGTTNTQTLTNKTLTSPTINAGTMTGIIAGTPDFSGRVDFLDGIAVSDDAAGVVLRATAGPTQSADIFRAEANGGTAHVRVDSTGATTFAQSSTFSSDLTVTGVLNPARSSYKVSDTSRVDTTLADDPDLSVPIVANASYLVDAYLVISGDSTDDMNVGWSVPSGAVGTWTPINFNVGTSGNSGSVELVASAFSTARSFGLHATPTTEYGILVRGWIVTSATAGNLVVKWAKLGNVTGNAATMNASSWLKVERLS